MVELLRRAVEIIKNRMITSCITVLVLTAIFLLNSEKERSITITDTFDTVITITAYSSSNNAKEYEKIIRDTDKMFSSDNPDGEIYRLNHNKKAELSPETVDLLCDAVTYTNRLSEYFDISVNPLSELWDIKNNSGIIPDNISETAALVGIEALVIDTDGNTAEIVRDGASITLGAIAKGYTTDLLVAAMRKNGEKSALINMGGNIYAMGAKKDGSLWKIGIADPLNMEQNAVILNISDTAVITSGNYERYFELDGIRYHHIIDPKTGYPAQSGLNSATAVGADAELCDVLSTAMFAAGVEKSKSIIAEYKIDAVLIDDETVYYTAGLEDRMIKESEYYNYVCLDLYD